MAIDRASNLQIHPLDLDESDLGILPTSLARELQCVLIRKTGGTFLVASAVPFSAAELERLEYILDGKVKVLVKGPDVIQSTLARHYPVDAVESGSRLVSYWADSGRIVEDGTLVIFTGSVADGFFVSGFVEYSPNHPDFAFWSWVIRRPEFRRRLTPRQVVGIRRIWRRFLRASRCGRVTVRDDLASPQR